MIDDIGTTPLEKAANAFYGDKIIIEKIKNNLDDWEVEPYNRYLDLAKSFGQYCKFIQTAQLYYLVTYENYHGALRRVEDALNVCKGLKQQSQYIQGHLYLEGNGMYIKSDGENIEYSVDGLIKDLHSSLQCAKKALSEVKSLIEPLRQLIESFAENFEILLPPELRDSIMNPDCETIFDLSIPESQKDIIKMIGKQQSKTSYASIALNKSVTIIAKSNIKNLNIKEWMNPNI